MDNKALELKNHNAYWFLFCNDELLLKENGDRPQMLSLNDINQLETELTDVQSIGVFHATECFIANISIENIPAGFYFSKVRPLYGQLDDELFWFICRGFHLNNWMKTTKYCGCCGSINQITSEEIAMKCTNCGSLVYPRISPAIIVAVTRNKHLLLARSTRFPPNRYSVIAGFVEPGETLEQCVRRELQEEVGVEVHNINYFASQPWPFPDSLMVAFTAECDEEKITIDNQEIVAADWFRSDNLPDIPEKPSVGRQLIDWFIANN